MAKDPATTPAKKPGRIAQVKQVFVSAKAVDFNAQGEHVSYDFDRCVQLCERAGFKGIYLVEQWSRKDQALDYEKIADWLLQRVRADI